MPWYSWHCEAGHEFDRFYTLESYINPTCCECGAPAVRVYKAPNLIGRREIFYTSPIDGRPITSERARQEDLARNNCRPYDPEMKKDYLRRNADAQDKLENDMAETVEREIEAMPSDKREKLHAELIGGAEVATTRYTPKVKPLKVKVTSPRPKDTFGLLGTKE